MKYPLLCLSHTLKSSAVLRCDIGGASAFDATFPAGVYWTDPLYNGQASDVASVDLLHFLAALFDAANGGAYTERPSWNPTYLSGLDVVSIAGFRPTWDSGEVLNVLTTHANTNAGGRAIVKRFGGSQVTAGIIESDGLNNTNFTAHGMWMPGRAESGNVDSPEDGRGSVVRSDSGVAYGYNLGSPLARRTLTLAGIEGRRVFDRLDTFATLDQNYAFQRTMWYLLQRGERIRYYQDYSATKTYLTSVMTTTSATAVVKSSTGIIAGRWIWINGERTLVSNVAGTTLTLYRPDPVAHAVYDPISVNEVSTWVLDNSGGEISMEAFNPSRRAPNQDRWDFSISLLRSS